MPQSSEGGSSSSDDESSPRKFDISELIAAHFKSRAKQLPTQWSFVLDDGVFERQANVHSMEQLWHHLANIERQMARYRTKAKKGTVYLFKNPSLADWQSESALCGTCTLRFSRKFSVDLGELWVLLVLLTITGQLPFDDPEQVLGLVFSTRKGKSEMQLFLRDEPWTRDLEDDSLLREALNIDQRDAAIQIKFKSYHDLNQRRLEEEQRQRDEERVKMVNLKKDKARSWPLVKPKPPSDDENELEALRMRFRSEEPTPVVPYQYQFAAPLLTSLVEQQLVSLVLAGSSDSEGPAPRPAPPRAPVEQMTPLSEHTALEGGLPLAPLAPSQQGAAPVDRTPAHPPQGSLPDPSFERHMLYGSERDERDWRDERDERDERDGRDTAEADSSGDIADLNPPSPPCFAPGTNPPDFSSPVMKAALSYRDAKNPHHNVVHPRLPTPRLLRRKSAAF